MSIKDTIAKYLGRLNSHEIVVHNESTTPLFPTSSPTPTPTPKPTPMELFPPMLIEKLIFAESSGNPASKAVGIDSKTYRGLMGMGETAWKEVNDIRKKEGLPQHPFSMSHDPKLNREYGTTYMNRRVPEIINNFELPLNPLMGLILYGGWFSDMRRAKGDITKMKKSAQTYFKNVLGEDLPKYAPEIRAIYYSKLGQGRKK